MRQFILTLTVGLLVACGDDPSSPPPAANQLRVINGPATCNACNGLEFTVAGPGLSKVIDASLKNHATGADVETSAEIRHFVGDSGAVLEIKLTFVGSAPKGDYDLRLHTVDIGGAQGSLNVPAAVKIIAPPVDPNSPPPPPGPTGTVRVTATTSGPLPPLKYGLTVDPCDPLYACSGRDIDPTGSVSIQLNPGSYVITLTNVPANCTVAQPSLTATVVVNQTVNVSFAVSCVVVRGGSIRITAPTTGALPRSPYEAIVNPCDLVHPCSASMPAGGSGTIVQVPGNYTVSLGNVPSTCTVAEPRSVAVTVTANQTVDVSFSVTCPPAGTVRVSATVTGPNPDESLRVLEGSCDYYYDDCNIRDLTVGGNVEFSLIPGTYTIALTGVAQNCSVALPNPRSVTVVANVETEITFAVTCVAITTIRVSVTTTGPDADPFYQVWVGDCPLGPCSQQPVEAGSFTDFLVSAGTYTVLLNDVAPNCTVSGTNPVVVTTTATSATNVTFQVTCTALPVVRVTAPTGGTNRDAAYAVVNESTCDFYYGCYQQALPATGSVEFKVATGSYVFRLIDIASNCTVNGNNPRTVNVVASGTTDLVFPVTCQ